jgi:hypothetical protein
LKEQSRLALDNAEITRMAKQRYLIKEVVQRGYSKDAFQTFLIQKKPEHIPEEHCLNVDLWTFEELDKLVLDFQYNVQSAP